MILQARVFQLIRSTLANDAQSATKAPGGIWQTAAPAGTTQMPWVVFAQQATLRDIQARGGQVVMAKGLVTVQAVAQAGGNGQPLQDCADWIDTLINPLLGAAGGATVIRLVRDREIAYDELVKPVGVLYSHLGFVYQWWAQ